MCTTRPFERYHAVVTGAARGIGATIAMRLASGGARLSLMGRNSVALEAFAATIPSNATANAIVCDVQIPDSVSEAFSEARAAHGPVDILVNNAGQAASSPFSGTSDALWQNMLAVNLTGTFLCTRAALPDMVLRNSGRIINIASTAGQRGYAYVAAYVAAKHGVIGLTRALALEVATSGITVNAVCPGFIDTDLFRESVSAVVAKTGRSETEIVAEFLKHNPQRRLVSPDQVAATVEWLCGHEASSITGQSISICGGEVMA